MKVSILISIDTEASLTEILCDLEKRLADDETEENNLNGWEIQDIRTLWNYPKKGE